jgi:hypothetical protein
MTKSLCNSIAIPVFFFVISIIIHLPPKAYRLSWAVAQPSLGGGEVHQ